MTMAASRPVPGLPGAGEATRWALAGAVVLAAHAAALYVLRDLAPAEPPLPAALEQSMEVELAPLEISQADAVESEPLPPAEAPDRLEPAETLPEILPPTAEPLAPAEPERLAAVEPPPLLDPPPLDPPLLETPPPLEATPVEPVQPAEPVQPETAEPPPPETLTAEPVEPQTLQPAEPLPPLSPPLTVSPAPSVTAEAVLPETPQTLEPVEDFAEMPDTVALLPQVRPAVEEPIPPRPRRQAQPRRERAQEQARPRREPQQTQRATPPPSAASSASRAASAPRIDPGRWQSQVQSRVARSLRGLRGRGFAGYVSVRFTVSASGAISGARVARSSGDSAIDQAAVSAVARVSVPPPPPGVGRTLTVPVTFN